MRVLIGCKHSGVMRRAFRRLGHDAWSNDILPSDDDSEFHLQMDVFKAIALQHWDLAIFHPDCTFLTCSAEWAYSDGPYHQKVKPETLVGAERRAARNAAVAFVAQLWAADIPRKAIENPIGALSSRWRPADQIVHPHWFGDDASKATGLWLDGLPLLKKTAPVAPRLVMNNGKMRQRWANQTDSGQNRLSPSPDRWKLRADTYPGLAAACADQWGR